MEVDRPPDAASRLSARLTGAAAEERAWLLLWV